MASSALMRLLQQLLRRNYRQDKAFDKYQIRFLKKLQAISTDEDQNKLFDDCVIQLATLPNNLDDKLSEGRLISRHSTAQLQEIDSLSDTIKDRLQEMQNGEAPYSIIEHQVELKELIKIYQRAVIELSKRSIQADDNKSEVEFINEELQQVILELDVGEAYIQDLEKLRIRISNESDPFQLPHHCLQVINLIINSTREERSSSRHFLYTLNDSLTAFYLNFAKTITATEAGFSQQKDTFTSIEKNAKILQQQSEEAQDIDSLRNYIASYVSEVQNVIAEQEKKKEQKFRHKLQGMVRQIKELQSETQSYQKTLKHQTKQLHVDFLTKIPNRAAWSERLEIEMTRLKRYNNPLQMAVIDIDNFKNINDNFGHLAGDKVLHAIAQTLQKSIRKTDYIARFGGEEFALLLPEINQQQAQFVLNKLRDRIKAITFRFKEENLIISISVGFTTLARSDDQDEAFERADTALYQAKAEGKDRVIFIEKAATDDE